MTGKQPAKIGVIDLPVRRLHVELTNRCNFSCEFCPDRTMRRSRGSMPLPMVERLLTEAGRDGIARQVHFHVLGEPLLWPDLAEAVRIASRCGLDPWVTTNGSLLSSSLLMEFQAAGLSNLIVSVQTPDAVTFGLRGSRFLTFESYRQRLVGAIRTFLPHASGMHLSVCFLSNPLRRFHAPGASTIRLAESGTELRAHMRRWVEWILKETEFEGQIPEVLHRLRKVGILQERRVRVTAHLDFRVRVVGNWAGHFEGTLSPARFGYCPGLSENFGVLWNGDYVICCADYDGKTVLANFAEMGVREYLSLPAVQEIAGAFRRYRVVHPHCAQCLGDRHPVSSLLRQAGSIVYFRVYRKLRREDQVEREVA